MKRDHLVPRVVIAANGKAVTRWVRPEGSSSAARGIPSPAPSNKQADDLSLRIVKADLAKAISEINIDEFGDWDNDDDRNDCYARLKESLDHYRPETVYALDELFHEREDSRLLLADLVPRQESDEFVQDIVHCFDALSATSEDIATEDYASTFYAVEFYDQIVPIENGVYPERRKEQVSALITVTDGMERMLLNEEIQKEEVQYLSTKDKLNVGAVITNAEIAGLLLEKSNDAHRIVTLMRERGADAASIRMALEHDVTVLSDGSI